MKKSTLFLTTFLLIITISGVGSATTILDPNNGEMNLFQIWNTLFTDTQNSSQDLFNTHGVPDGMDSYWQVANNDAHIYTRGRYAGYGQAIGIDDSTGESILVSSTNWGLEFLSSGFTTTGSFSWFDEYTHYGVSSERWYSNNTLGGNDHFVALAVPDLLVGNYNRDNNIDLMGNVYLMAFEDLDLGDQDYNDLVFIVDNITPSPVPEPATMLLFGSGLIGLAGFSRKRVMKKIFR